MRSRDLERRLRRDVSGQGIDQLPGRRHPLKRLRRPPEFFSDSEAGQKLANGASMLVAGAAAVLTSALSWPVRLAAVAVISVGVRWLLWLVARRAGEERTGFLLSRAMRTVVWTLVNAMLLWGLLWAVIGHDPTLVLSVACPAVLVPVWWVLLTWWDATSPTPGR